jgi:phosphomannomutase / phosphoglucomutase
MELFIILSVLFIVRNLSFRVHGSSLKFVLSGSKSQKRLNFPFIWANLVNKIEGVLMKTNPLIFREYDIRGVMDQDLSPEFAYSLGQGFGTYVRRLDKTNLAVGRDGRLSSMALQQALIEGITSTGCHVIDIGLCPTPVFYFSLFHLDREGGVMVTGSHNPPDYNGFKVSVGKTTIFGEEIQRLRAIIDRGEFISEKGSVSKEEIIAPYQAYLKKRIEIRGTPKVVIDAGNGTGGTVAGPLLRDLGCDVEELFCEIDGRFPNHFPDPTLPENLTHLIRRVKETHADAGIGYDGDADRIGVVDDLGNVMLGDHLMILFTREILKEKKGATIIAEVKCSENLYREIEKCGGKGIMWKAGHSLIKEKMREENALLAGEMSGHICFADRYFGFDDAIYASCRLLEILSKTGRKLSELFSDIPKTVSTPEIRIECPDEIKFDVAEDVKNGFKKDYPVIDIDGARVDFGDGWGLVRASNTQPVVVLRFEAPTETRLQEIRHIIETKVEQAITRHSRFPEERKFREHGNR